MAAGTTELRALPRVVWVLSGARFVFAATSFVVLYLTLYLTGPRGLPVSAAGLISGTYGAGLLTGYLTTGRIADRIGHRRTTLTGFTGLGVLLVALPWMPLPLVPVALPVMGYLQAGASTAESALAALAVPVGERRTAVAVARSAFNCGLVLGPPLGALLILAGYPVLFVVQGLAMLAAVAVLARLLPRSSVQVSTEHHSGLLRSIVANRPLAVLLAAAVVTDIVNRQLVITFPVYLGDRGQTVTLYATLIAVSALLQVTVEVPVAIRLRNRPPLKIVALGYGLVGTGIAVLVAEALPVVVMAAAATVVVTAGEILYKPTAAAYVLDVAQTSRIGQYQGVYAGACTCGTLLSGPVGGALYPAGPAVLWSVCAAMALAAAAAVLVTSRTTS
jgi:MFS family permease